MVIVDTGLNEISNVMGDGGTTPQGIGIGTGSATVGSTDSALITETDRNAIFSRDTSQDREVTYIGDFSALEMSGTILTEFGMFDTTTSGPTSKMYQHEVIGSQVFDGTNELQIQISHLYSRG
jgi:hypothetical protein